MSGPRVSDGDSSHGEASLSTRVSQATFSSKTRVNGLCGEDCFSEDHLLCSLGKTQSPVAELNRLALVINHCP